MASISLAAIERLEQKHLAQSLFDKHAIRTLACNFWDPGFCLRCIRLLSGDRGIRLISHIRDFLSRDEDPFYLAHKFDLPVSDIEFLYDLLQGSWYLVAKEAAVNAYLDGA